MFPPRLSWKPRPRPLEQEAKLMLYPVTRPPPQRLRRDLHIWSHLIHAVLRALDPCSRFPWESLRMVPTHLVFTLRHHCRGTSPSLRLVCPSIPSPVQAFRARRRPAMVALHAVSDASRVELDGARNQAAHGGWNS